MKIMLLLMFTASGFLATDPDAQVRFQATEELLDRKIAAPVYKNREYGRRDPSH
jgi:hypothetical protein